MPEGKLLALQMSFQLPPSCYATMLVRELLKETTASTTHRDRTLADQETLKSEEAFKAEAELKSEEAFKAEEELKSEEAVLVEASS